MTTARNERNLRIVVIGAGMSGILCGIRLQQEGFSDFTIYEKGETVGGTWRENHYPGLECDVPSHVYSYSFEPNPHWSHRFSPGAEIQAYFEGVARKHGVLSRIRFGAEITSCVHRAGRWHLETASGQRDAADVVICATGILHHPNIPRFEGLESFAGAAFHSARWDDRVSLAGKRLGIVGTGSTAVQITGAVVDEVASLTLFQRTAQWIFPQPNPTYSDDDQARFAEDAELLRFTRARLAQRFNENFSSAVVDADSERMRVIEETCRQNLEESVRDPELKRRLTPDYRAACKRLVMSGNFYEAIQQPNAHLVTEPIQRVEPRGVRTADGVLHELDVLVLATGFNPHQFMRPMNVVGRGGLSLNELWADAAYAYRSVSLPGFPNFFMLVGPQSPVGNFSVIEIAEMQLAYVLQLIARIRRRECAEVCASPAATRRFNEAVMEAMKGTIWVTGCRSWYLDERGVPATWPWTLERFEREMRAPLIEDYEVA